MLAQLDDLVVTMGQISSSDCDGGPVKRLLLLLLFVDYYVSEILCVQIKGAMQFAARIAGINCTRQGCDPPTQAELF